MVPGLQLKKMTEPQYIVQDLKTCLTNQQEKYVQQILPKWTKMLLSSSSSSESKYQEEVEAVANNLEELFDAFILILCAKLDEDYGGHLDDLPLDFYFAAKVYKAELAKTVHYFETTYGLASSASSSEVIDAPMRLVIEDPIVMEHLAELMLHRFIPGTSTYSPLPAGVDTIQI